MPSARRQPPPQGLVHRVSQGENLESIAFVYGHFSRYVWEHERNEQLRATRGDPNVLFPGDIVFVPGLRQRLEEKSTGRRHVFRRRGVPSILRFRALVAGRPLAEQPYVVEIDDAEIHGTTDAGGMLECFVRPDAPEASIRIGVEPLCWKFEVSLRTVDPVSEVAGVQNRLSNLGLLQAPSDGVLDEQTRKALRVFQCSEGLEPTGEPDEPTRERLRKVHGS